MVTLNPTKSNDFRALTTIAKSSFSTFNGTYTRSKSKIELRVLCNIGEIECSTGFPMIPAVLSVL